MLTTKDHPLLGHQKSAKMFFPTSLCGVLVFDSVSRLRLAHLRLRPSVTHHLCHTIFDTPSVTHHFDTHHLSHTTLSHHLFHTPLRHFVRPFTHHFDTHNLSHTALTHTHTPSVTHHLTHTIFHHFDTHHLDTYYLSPL